MSWKRYFTPVEGQAEEFEDRNSLINAVIAKINEPDK